jgi:predicted DCC family thiol-disulfide oxidoreductase YuxK
MPQPARPTHVAADRAYPKNPTLIYDGECGICQQAVVLLKRWDREHVLRYLPFQDQAAVVRFGIGLPALAAAMHLLLPDGRVYPGADAVPHVLRLFPGMRWLAPLFLIPGVLPLARWIYAWIARRRHCLVRGMEGR